MEEQLIKDFQDNKRKICRVIFDDFLSLLEEKEINYNQLFIREYKDTTSNLYFYFIVENQDKDWENSDENDILSAEAEINGKYSDTGISVDTMIVEDWENLEPTSEYTEIEDLENVEAENYIQ